MKAYQLIPGDIVSLPEGTTEVVRSVFVVVQLANGMDRRFAPEEDVRIFEQGTRPAMTPLRETAGSPPASPTLPAPPVPPTAPPTRDSSEDQPVKSKSAAKSTKSAKP